MKCEKWVTFLMDILYIPTQLDCYAMLFTCNLSQ